jgi:hypothetical protein
MYDTRQIIMGGQADGAIERYTAVQPGVSTTTAFARAAGVTPPIGINSNVNTALGERADIVIFGPHKGRLGGVAVARGTWLKADGLGRLIAAVAGDFAIARAEIAGNALEIIDIFVMPVKV